MRPFSALLPSKLTNFTSSDLDNVSIPLTSTLSNTHTFAANPFAPITVNGEHYSLIHIGYVPSPAMSDYSVNASVESPTGSRPASPPSCYSPRTVENIFAGNSDIDNGTLRDIATGLVQTVKNREEVHRFAVLAFEDKIKRLESAIEGYAETYERAPEGYVRNTMYPDLKIPHGKGAYSEAYWVTPAHDGYVQAYSQEQGPLDTPYSLPIYARPIYSSEPIEPIPAWFHQLLVGTPAVYANFTKAAHQLDDWGVAADIARYRKLDDDLSCINAEIERLEAEAGAARIAKTICEGRLELARAPKQLAHMECLATPFVRQRNEQLAVRGGWKKSARGRAS